jgi:hypothetical protein
MTTMTSAEQLMLELINRARMDPDAEVTRIAQELNVPFTSLNQFIQTTENGYPITSTPKQVLAGNNTLTGVAEAHSSAMSRSQTMSHSGLADGGQPWDRIAAAGYSQNPLSFYRDENIQVEANSAALTQNEIATLVKLNHDDLFYDDPTKEFGDPGGHRLAMLDDNMREIGVGVVTGTYAGYNAVYVTEEFGVSGTSSFLTGAVYNDANGNNFYDLNEGVQGVTATVTTTGGTLVGSDTTGSGGGWSVSEPGGTYNVTFTGAGLAAGGVSATVAGGNLNAKVDLVNGNEIFSNANTTLGGGAKELHLLGIGNINGTGNALDNVLYGTKGNNVIDGGIGTDTVVYSGNKASYTITSNADGSTTVSGPEGTDTLISIENIKFADQTYSVPSANPGSVSINDVSITEGNSGTQLMTFTVTRSGGTAAFDVNYATQDGTATAADNDYASVPATALHFNAGDTTKTVSVAINGDTKVEGNETFNVLLSGATNGATISKGTGAGTIINDDVTVIDSPPTVTGSNVTATHGQSFAASSLFTARDADGDAITKYAFWDTGTGGGHFVLNGVVQGVGQEIDVTAAQLSQLSYQSGTGADTLWVAAYDGKQWGNWSNSFTVTGKADTAPTVTASNVAAAHGQSFAASSLFTASDADGDAITKYAFFNTGSGGGHFVLNGVAQGVGREIDVTAAQLSQLSYQSGSGADTLWVGAYDGTQWSNWSNSFTVTAPIDSGPTVTPTNSAIKSFANQTFAASSLFTYSDPFGSPATQYDFWNTGDGGGHFVLNGTALPANQHNIISAAQLGQLSYQVGTGSDTLWVGANDGTVWGNWSQSFTISDPPAVAAGETITLGSGYAGQVSFLSDTGTLKLENSSSFTGTVAGLRGRDAIDFADIGFGANSTLGYSANADHSGGTLCVGDGVHMANIALLGSYMASSFVAASDGHGGTLISEAAHASTQTPLVTQPHA